MLERVPGDLLSRPRKLSLCGRQGLSLNTPRRSDASALGPANET